MSAQSIYNLVRGLATPYVGAHFLFNDIEIKVWKSALFEGGDNNIEPGKVFHQTNSGLVVKCGEGAISLLVTEPEFKVKVGTYL
jgi:methionyl-tRNA formyltransferase